MTKSVPGRRHTAKNEANTDRHCNECRATAVRQRYLTRWAVLSAAAGRVSTPAAAATQSQTNHRCTRRASVVVLNTSLTLRLQETQQGTNEWSGHVSVPGEYHPEPTSGGPGYNSHKYRHNGPHCDQSASEPAREH